MLRRSVVGGLARFIPSVAGDTTLFGKRGRVCQIVGLSIARIGWLCQLATLLLISSQLPDFEIRKCCLWQNSF